MLAPTAVASITEEVVGSSGGALGAGRAPGGCGVVGGRAGRANAKPCLRETRGEKGTLWPPRGGGLCFDTRCCRAEVGV